MKKEDKESLKNSAIEKLTIAIHNSIYNIYTQNFDDYETLQDLWHEDSDRFMIAVDLEISSTLLDIDCEVGRGLEYDLHKSLPKGHICSCFM